VSARELVVLGTASQVPTRHRNHNGYLLRWDGAGILFDPGEGTQRQMILAGASMTDVTAVCITHFHGDHCLGLPGVVQRLSLDGVERPVDVCYPASGQDYFERLRSASIFDDRTKLDTVPISEPGTVVAHRGLQLRALPLAHRVDTWGYRVQEPDKRSFVRARLQELGIEGRAVGELQRHGEVEIGGRTVRYEDVSVPRRGQSFAFVMDTRVCDNAVELARGVDLLVCESTFLDAEEDLAASYEHLTATQAATIAREAGARRLVLAHFSQRHPDEQEYVAEARRVHADVVAATDGMRILMPRRRRA
jgi:ribonuclease Z